MSIQNVCPEMGKYLRQIVDNYLEEGQFESGIAILDQIRSPDHKPSIIHILHLIFIALHSASHDTRLDESGTEPPYDPSTLLLQSPRKIVKQSKSALILSPDTVVASQRLLFAFLSTNSPSDIAAALPHYPDNEIRRQVSTEGEGNAHFGFDYLDSPIYNQSASIRNSRSVWEVLKERYAHRAMQVFGTPQPRSKGKQGLKTRGLGRELSFNTSAEVEELDVVGEDSWFLLEWLVALFEKDAEMTQTQGMGRYSRLLLRQLPPPPLNTATRWDASEPLKAIAFSLQQSDSRRQRIGLRLLNLLIDLSQTPYLNLSSLTSTALAQITSFSISQNKTPDNGPSSLPITPPHHLSNISTNKSNPLTTLFDRLSSTVPSLAFKISLCQKILQDTDDISAAIPQLGSKANGRVTVNSNKTNDTDASQSRSTSSQLPLVSAMKRPTPRILPRPRGAAVVAPINPETEKTPSSQAPNPTIDGESSASTTIPPKDATTLPDIALPSAPVVHAPPPRPWLPSFASVSQLLKIQPKSEASLGASAQARARPRNGNASTNHVRSTAQTPWSAPGLVLRVKFELLHACTTLAKCTREELKANQAELLARTDVVDWTQSLSDGRMHELLLVAFGPQAPAPSEEEAEDKAFYADVIKAMVGFPIDAT